MSESRARVSRTCPKCHRVTVETESSYSCDHCGKALPERRCRVQAFHEDEEQTVEHRHYCDWGCLLADIENVECNSFISLPYIRCKGDEDGSTLGLAAFMAAVRAFGRENAEGEVASDSPVTSPSSDR